MQYEEWMNGADSVLWYIERDPVLRSTITAVLFLDRAPDPDRFARVVDSLPAGLPRLRQRVQDDRLGISAPRWIPDPAFRVEQHVHRHDLGGTGSDDDVLELAARLHTEPFDRTRPLWELHLLTGLDGDRAALAVKVHHTIGDGKGLVLMTAALVQFERDAEIDEAAVEETADEADPSPMPPFVDALRHRVQGDAKLTLRAGRAMLRNATAMMLDPVRRTRDIAETAGSIGKLLMPASSPLSPVMTERSQDYRLTRASWPLAAFKSAAKSYGATVNDIFVSGLVDGLRRYHDHHGSSPEQLRLTMPISVRRQDEDAAGNRFVPCRFVVPLQHSDPDTQVAVFSALLRSQRNEPGLGAVGEVSDVLSRLGPVGATAVIAGMMKAVDVTASNVPGVDAPLYLAGSKIEELVPYGPCAGAAINVTLFSYDGTASIGITSDRAAVPDTDVLRTCIVEGLDAVLAVSG